MLSPSDIKGVREQVKQMLTVPEDGVVVLWGIEAEALQQWFDDLEERLGKAGDNMKKAHEHLTDGIEKSTEHQPCFFASIRANELIAEALAELSPSDQ